MQQKTLSYCKFPEICADKESKDVHWVSLYEKNGITYHIGVRVRLGNLCNKKETQKAISRNLSLFCGTPEGTRTPNIQNRNLTLYPIELRTHFFSYYNKSTYICKDF